MEQSGDNQSGPPVTLLPTAIAHNTNVLYNSRILVFTLAGTLAGVLGFTGINGFLFYFVTFFLLSTATLQKLKMNTETYFQSIWNVYWDGIFHGMLTYILFWTLSYNIVHIY